jgi:ubiquinone/menaquinone biosynthesis C-methylase UbiE
VLDVACGNGISAAFLADHFGCEVVGVNYSGWNITQAQGLAAQKGLSRIHCERADAERLPFTNAPSAPFRSASASGTIIPIRNWLEQERHKAKNLIRAAL